MDGSGGIAEQATAVDRAQELLAAEAARGVVPDGRTIAVVLGTVLGVLGWILTEASAQARIPVPETPAPQE